VNRNVESFNFRNAFQRPIMNAFVGAPPDVCGGGFFE
jgi:hypothetical protein